MIHSLQLDSPAKVNLRLEILKKREDGYHELRTVFQKISLHDTLHFSLKKERGISITTDHPGLPVGKKNLVYQAAQSILEVSGYPGGVSIGIKKRIPLGAGLGGGSSNAAATLKALNKLLKVNLTQKELMKIGLKIGADVPFFFLKSDAIAFGVGERLKKKRFPHLWYVLIYPNFEVSTRWAYQNFAFARGSNGGIQGLTNRQFHINLHKFQSSSEGISRILLNHLETVVSKKYPQIKQMEKILFSAGALGAMMTGSGPTVFGIFSGEKVATKAFQKTKELAERRGWVVFKAHSIIA